MENIVWLASYPKSGSTWIRAFFANLSADQALPLRPNQIRSYSDFEAQAERFTHAAGRPSIDLSAADIAALRRQVQSTIACRAQGMRLVMTHNFCGKFAGHPLVNWKVTAGAIYVVRNPLDVVVSMTRHFGITLDAAITLLGDERVASENDKLFVTNFIGSWSTHVKSWTAAAAAMGPGFVVVRYEDLLADPVKHFGAIAKLFGLADDKSRIERAVRHSNFRTLAALEREIGFVEAVDDETRFFFSGKANQWRDSLTQEQVRSVVAQNRAEMERFGYLP